MERIGQTMSRALLALTFALAGGLFAGLGMTPGPAQADRQAAPSRVWQQPATDVTMLVASQPLTTGCNQVTETGLPVGGKVSDWVTQNVQPTSAVISVWHYDNASQHYQAAYFNVSAVPVDVTTFPAAVDAYFICVAASATAP